MPSSTKSWNNITADYGSNGVDYGVSWFVNAENGFGLCTVLAAGMIWHSWHDMAHGGRLYVGLHLPCAAVADHHSKTNFTTFVHRFAGKFEACQRPCCCICCQYDQCSMTSDMPGPVVGALALQELQCTTGTRCNVPFCTPVPVPSAAHCCSCVAALVNGNSCVVSTGLAATGYCHMISC
jgi:hypothetical protein